MKTGRKQSHVRREEKRPRAPARSDDYEESYELARPNESRLRKLIRRERAGLYQGSIIHRFFGRIRIRGKVPFDDRVKTLEHSTLGMFFYNQRAIFFGLGLTYLAILGILTGLLPSNEEMRRTVLVLAGFWVVGVLTTGLLHRWFVRDLTKWASDPTPNRLPPMFGRYFLLDFLVVFLLVVIGRRLGLKLDVFAFLLIANTVVYGAYVGGGRGFNLLITALLFLLLVVTFILPPGTIIVMENPLWFYAMLYLGPLLGMILVTVLSVMIISYLRTTEHIITQRHLELLGQYEDILSGTLIRDSDAKNVQGSSEQGEHEFRNKVKDVLKNLCNLGENFWYHSGCLWFIETHQDRGEVLLPGPTVRFPEAKKWRSGIDGLEDFLGSKELTVLRSTKYLPEEYQGINLKFRGDVDAPAAYIPLRRDRARSGVLALYGREGGPPIQWQEAFLRSLGSIISNTMEQWEGRYKVFPQREMDELFNRNSLDEVFPQAAKILQRYLEAEACMVIFRPDPTKPEMELKAAEGFIRSIRKDIYKVGEGLTGICAEDGRPIRLDDVSKHLDEFDSDLLGIVEKSLGRKITSWMAIPIGPMERNFGVIKVVNSQFRCNWFTEDDEKLASDLALHLHVIIEKFQHIKQTEREREKAEQNARKAKQEQGKAEKAARQRQDDLMIITHQLQGPLNSVIGAVSRLQRKTTKEDFQIRLEHVDALVEDCLSLCWGTFTSFGDEAGRKPSFGAVEIDAPKELKELCQRLQRTNSRSDLKFVYEKDSGFPTLKMDRNVFTSVFYSLIHNAMKYANQSSKVFLLCTFEGKDPALKVKSIGEPILPSEKDLIFQKYKRGQVVEDTGRHHSGVGLGLWVARQLMRAIDGELSVELSPTQPELSVFIVHVPHDN